jgi:hypothetical protein
MVQMIQCFIYTIKCSENLKETEISSYIQYLFDNIILINIWRIDYE